MWPGEITFPWFADQMYKYMSNYFDTPFIDIEPDLCLI